MDSSCCASASIFLLLVTVVSCAVLNCGEGPQASVTEDSTVVYNSTLCPIGIVSVGNVTVAGGATLLINLTTLLLDAQGIGRLTAITLSNVTLLNGAKLWIAAPSTEEDLFAMSGIHVVISSLSLNNAAVYLVGVMPPNSTIIIADVAGTTTSMREAPYFTSELSFANRSYCILCFLGFGLIEHSTLALVGSNRLAGEFEPIGGARADLAVISAVAFLGQWLLIKDYSSISLTSLEADVRNSFSGPELPIGVMFDVAGPVSLSNGSALRFVGVSVRSDVTAVRFAASSTNSLITVAQSAVEFVDCNFSSLEADAGYDVDGVTVLQVDSGLVLDQNSTFLIKRSRIAVVATDANWRQVKSLQFSRVTLKGGSTILISGCLFNVTMLATVPFVFNNSTIFRFTQSLLVLTSSGFYVLDVMFAGATSSTSSRSLQVDSEVRFDASTMLWQRCDFDHVAFTIDTRTLRVENASWIGLVDSAVRFGSLYLAVGSMVDIAHVVRIYNDSNILISACALLSTAAAVRGISSGGNMSIAHLSAMRFVALNLEARQEGMMFATVGQLEVTSGSFVVLDNVSARIVQSVGIYFTRTATITNQSHFIINGSCEIIGGLRFAAVDISGSSSLELEKSTVACDDTSTTEGAMSFWMLTLASESSFILRDSYVGAAGEIPTKFTQVFTVGLLFEGSDALSQRISIDLSNDSFFVIENSTLVGASGLLARTSIELRHFCSVVINGSTKMLSSAGPALAINHKILLSESSLFAIHNSTLSFSLRILSSAFWSNVVDVMPCNVHATISVGYSDQFLDDAGIFVGNQSAFTLGPNLTVSSPNKSVVGPINIYSDVVVENGSVLELRSTSFISTSSAALTAPMVINSESEYGDGLFFVSLNSLVIFSDLYFLVATATAAPLFKVGAHKVERNSTVSYQRFHQQYLYTDDNVPLQHPIQIQSAALSSNSSLILVSLSYSGQAQEPLILVTSSVSLFDNCQLLFEFIDVKQSDLVVFGRPVIVSQRSLVAISNVILNRSAVSFAAVTVTNGSNFTLSEWQGCSCPLANSILSAMVLFTTISLNNGSLFLVEQMSFVGGSASGSVAFSMSHVAVNNSKYTFQHVVCTQDMGFLFNDDGGIAGDSSSELLWKNISLHVSGNTHGIVIGGIALTGKSTMTVVSLMCLISLYSDSIKKEYFWIVNGQDSSVRTLGFGTSLLLESASQLNLDTVFIVTKVVDSRDRNVAANGGLMFTNDVQLNSGALINITACRLLGGNGSALWFPRLTVAGSATFALTDSTLTSTGGFALSVTHCDIEQTSVLMLRSNSIFSRGSPSVFFGDLTILNSSLLVDDHNGTGFLLTVDTIFHGALTFLHCVHIPHVVGDTNATGEGVACSNSTAHIQFDGDAVVSASTFQISDTRISSYTLLNFSDDQLYLVDSLSSFGVSTSRPQLLRITGGLHVNVPTSRIVVERCDFISLWSIATLDCSASNQFFVVSSWISVARPAQLSDFSLQISNCSGGISLSGMLRFHEALSVIAGSLEISSSTFHSVNTEVIAFSNGANIEGSASMTLRNVSFASHGNISAVVAFYGQTVLQGQASLVFQDCSIEHLSPPRSLFQLNASSSEFGAAMAFVGFVSLEDDSSLVLSNATRLVGSSYGLLLAGGLHVNVGSIMMVQNQVTLGTDSGAGFLVAGQSLNALGTVIISAKFVIRTALQTSLYSALVVRVQSVTIDGTLNITDCTFFTPRMILFDNVSSVVVSGRFAVTHVTCITEYTEELVPCTAAQPCYFFIWPLFVYNMTGSLRISDGGVMSMGSITSTLYGVGVPVILIDASLLVQRKGTFVVQNFSSLFGQIVFASGATVSDNSAVIIANLSVTSQLLRNRGGPFLSPTLHQSTFHALSIGSVTLSGDYATLSIRFLHIQLFNDLPVGGGDEGLVGVALASITAGCAYCFVELLSVYIQGAVVETPVLDSDARSYHIRCGSTELSGSSMLRLASITAIGTESGRWAVRGGIAFTQRLSITDWAQLSVIDCNVSAAMGSALSVEKTAVASTNAGLYIMNNTFASAPNPVNVQGSVFLNLVTVSGSSYLRIVGNIMILLGEHGPEAPGISGLNQFTVAGNSIATFQQNSVDNGNLCFSLPIVTLAGISSFRVVHNLCRTTVGVWKRTPMFQQDISAKFLVGCNTWSSQRNDVEGFPNTIVIAPECRRTVSMAPSLSLSSTAGSGSPSVSAQPTQRSDSSSLTTLTYTPALSSALSNCSVLLGVTSSTPLHIVIHSTVPFDKDVPWCWLPQNSGQSTPLLYSFLSVTNAAIRSVLPASNSSVCNAVAIVLDSATSTNRQDFVVTLTFNASCFVCTASPLSALSIALPVQYVRPPGAVPSGAVETTGAFVVASAIPLAVLVGPGAGAAMQRAMMQLQLAACDYSMDDRLDIATSPTTLGFGPASGRYVRGAVAGNLAVLGGICVLALVATWLRCRTARWQGREMTLWRGTASLALPGWLVAPLGFLLQPLTTVSVAAIVHAGDGAGSSDVALGSFGLVVCAVLCGCATWVVTAGFAAVGRPLDERRRSRWRNAAGSSSLGRMAGELLLPLFEWHDRVKGSMFVKRYETVFSARRPGRVWFVAVELWASFATGVIGGVMPPDEATCQRLLIAMCVLQVAQLVATVLLSPFNTKIDLVLTDIAAAAGALWNVLVLIPVDRVAAIVSLLQVYISVVSLLFLMLQLLVTGRMARGVKRAEALFRGGVLTVRSIAAARRRELPSHVTSSSESEDSEVAKLSQRSDECSAPLFLANCSSGAVQVRSPVPDVSSSKLPADVRTGASSSQLVADVRRPFVALVRRTPLTGKVLSSQRDARLRGLIELICKSRKM